MIPSQADDLAEVAMRLTNAHASFDRLCNALVRQTQIALGVPVSSLSEASVQEEFAALRQELRKYRPEFVQAYGALLSKHIGGEHLPEVVDALKSEAMRRYFGAVKSMEADFAVEMRELSRRMGNTCVYEPAAQSAGAEGG